MNVTIHPGRLSGRVEIPSSKSCAHRLMIASALSDEPAILRVNAVNDDILATKSCLESLGAKIDSIPGGFSISPIHPVKNAELFCGESGSTLRFLMPVAAALGTDAVFTGAGRLPERPNGPLIEALNAHGVRTAGEGLPLHLSGKLTGGRYEIAGNISSQYITGLLLALPLCEEPSEIALTTPLESASYVGITLETLRDFGIVVELTPTGWRIPGRQRYVSPGALCAEGDWSGAAFWLAANRLGSAIDVTGLREDSAQGDRKILEQLDQLGGEIDVSDTPDLAPVLAVAAAGHPGTTAITGAARLRIKESDRLAAAAEMLANLGGTVEEKPDGLIITGGAPLTGGTVRGYNDHRIVMSAAIAATICAGPVTITDAQAVRKSYPAFFEEYRRLGGQIHVE